MLTPNNSPNRFDCEKYHPLIVTKEGINYPLNVVSPPLPHLDQIENIKCFENLDVEEGYYSGVDFGAESEDYNFFSEDEGNEGD